MRCGCRFGLEPALLWLWCRLVAATLIRPLAWELPYASGVALKRQKKKKVHSCEMYSYLIKEGRVGVYDDFLPATEINKQILRFIAEEVLMEIFKFNFLNLFYRTVVDVRCCVKFLVYSRAIQLYMHNRLHLLIPNSQSIPPSCFPTTTSLFSMSVSLFHLSHS